MNLSREFFRFCLVGSVGFMVDASVLQLLVSQFHGDLFISRIFSYLMAASVTWIMHRHYTFQHNLVMEDGSRCPSSPGALASQWLRFVVTNGFGALTNYAVYVLCVLFSALCYEYPVLGVAAGSAVGLLFNYTVSRRFVFHRSTTS